MVSSTVVSCPGKVLLAGGYLVLSPLHQGFVVATPSRFYTVVRERADQSGNAGDAFDIDVRSPQFVGGSWRYRATKKDGEWVVDAADSSPANPFVHLSLSSSLLLSAALHPFATYKSLSITIVGANDFYSQPRTGAAPVPFAHLGVPISEVHKTGLGSSAAMVTSLTSALLLHFISPAPSPFSTTRPPNPDKATMELIHNLAQYVHSLAQGKVGSGFDVSAAVWGSQVYRRFAVECLGDLLDAKSTTKLTSKSLLTTLSPLVNALWTTTATAALVSLFALPPGTTLMLADVDAGSNTPSMVSKVLAWKKASPIEADALWDALKASNSDLAETFANLTRMSVQDSEAYANEVTALASTTGDQWTKSSYPFAAARSQILTTRSYMRKMGEESGVPIEPPSQSKLLDACSALPGVIGAGVPGAGGYDAIWVLVLSPPSSPSPLSAVSELLESWTEMSVRPLSKNAWVEGGKDESERGLLVEVLDQVEGLREVLQ